MNSISPDEKIVELATSLSRARVLSDTESRWLEQALRGESRRNGRKTRPWNKDDAKLKAMLRRGIRPAQIAIKLRRTPSAIYRRMYKLGLHCGKGSVALAANEG